MCWTGAVVVVVAWSDNDAFAAAAAAVASKTIAAVDAGAGVEASLRTS